MRQRPHLFVGWCSDGFKRARASGASQHVLNEPTTKRSRSEIRDPSSISKELCAEGLFGTDPDDVAGATGPAPSWYTGSKPSETALLNGDNGTGSIE